MLGEGTHYESASRQSNIQFRHVVDDMILDPEKRKAMVKWLAEFDNVRYRCLAHMSSSVT